MEHALAAMCHGLNRHHPLTLLIGHFGPHVGLAIDSPPRLAPVVRQQIFAQYPECEITPMDQFDDQGPAVWSMAVRLVPDIFALKTYDQFEDLLNRTTADPLSALLAAAGIAGEAQCKAWIEFTVRPASRFAVWRSKRLLRSLDRPLFQRWPQVALWYARSRCSASLLRRIAARFAAGILTLAGTATRHPDRAELRDYLAKSATKLDAHLFEAALTLRVAVPTPDPTAASDQTHAMFAALGAFAHGDVVTFKGYRPRPGYVGARRSHAFLLSAAELATLWHPASETVQAATLDVVASRQLEPPVELPVADERPAVALLGTTAFREQARAFGILPDDRRRHLAILGKTGMGKTTLLQSLIQADIMAGRGVGVIDPHGDLADTIQALVPGFRTNDVILFDAADAAYCLGFRTPLRWRADARITCHSSPPPQRAASDRRC
jgi:hypothetical protein